MAGCTIIYSMIIVILCKTSDRTRRDRSVISKTCDSGHDKTGWLLIKIAASACRGQECRRSESDIKSDWLGGGVALQLTCIKSTHSEWL